MPMLLLYIVLALLALGFLGMMYLLLPFAACTFLGWHRWGKHGRCRRCARTTLDEYFHAVSAGTARFEASTPWVSCDQFAADYRRWCKDHGVSAVALPRAPVMQSKRDIVTWYATRGEFSHWDTIRESRDSKDEHRHWDIEHRWSRTYAWPWWESSHEDYLKFILTEARAQLGRPVHAHHIASPEEFQDIRDSIQVALCSTDVLDEYFRMLWWRGVDKASYRDYLKVLRQKTNERRLALREQVPTTEEFFNVVREFRVGITNIPEKRLETYFEVNHAERNELCYRDFVAKCERDGIEPGISSADWKREIDRYVIHCQMEAERESERAAAREKEREQGLQWVPHWSHWTQRVSYSELLRAQAWELHYLGYSEQQAKRHEEQRKAWSDANKH